MKLEAFSDHELILIEVEISKALKDNQESLDAFYNDPSSDDDELRDIYVNNIDELGFIQSKIKTMLGYFPEVK